MTTAEAKIQDSLLGRYSELVKQINYHNELIAPFFSEMTTWEAKEYKAVNEQYLIEIESCKSAIMENETIFNELLACRNITVQQFFN